MENKDKEAIRVIVQNCIIYSNDSGDIFDEDRLIDAMESYCASQNEELIKENEELKQLIDTWKKYSEFLDKESRSFIQFAHIHGMKVSDEAIKKGKELREKIKQLTK